MWLAGSGVAAQVAAESMWLTPPKRISAGSVSVDISVAALMVITMASKDLWVESKVARYPAADWVMM
jgi:hypothetical protein